MRSRKRDILKQYCKKKRAKWDLTTKNNNKIEKVNVSIRHG